MAHEITVDGSTETVGGNNNFATEQEAREAIEKLKAMGGDWAWGEYDVREITECDSCLETGAHAPATTKSINPEFSGYQPCRECASEYDSRMVIRVN